MAGQNPKDADKKAKFNIADKIPAFASAGAKRNKNMIKIQQDLVERSIKIILQ